MATYTFLGEPPLHIKQWIMEKNRKDPLFFEANELGASVAMLCQDNIVWQQTDLKCHLQYSTDKMATWETYDGHIVELDDCVDNRVYFRADPENPNTNGLSKEDFEHDEAWTHYFKTEGSVKAGGSIQFMLESTGTRTDVPAYGFYYLFGYQEYDEETGESIGSCSSLTTAPELPAITLTDYCYANMFQGCTSLTQAPALPATTLTEGCYSGMFLECSSLTTAPVLPATTLANYCYRSMFFDCSKLTTMDVNFTVWNPTNATTDWLYNAGTEPTGEKTFTCPDALPETIGNSNIPEGWEIIKKLTKETT